MEDARHPCQAGYPAVARDDSVSRVSIARGTFIGFRADVATAASALLMSVIVARGLGPENRGVFFLALLVASVIALVGNLGLSTASIVFAATREIPLAQLHGIALLFSFGAALAGAAVLLGAEEFWTSEVLKGLNTVTIVLLCLGIAPTLYAQIAQALLTGLGRIPYVSAVRIAVAVANPIILIPVVVITNDPDWAVGAWLAVMAGNAVALGMYVFRRVGRPAIPEAHVLRRVVSFGTRGYVGTVAHQGFLRVDVFFISARFGPGLVGIYSLASVFAEQISLLGKAVYGASARSIGELETDSSAQLTARIVRLLVTLMVPVAIVLALLSKPGFPLVFGEDFEDAALPFALLLPGTICLALWYVVGPLHHLLAAPAGHHVADPGRCPDREPPALLLRHPRLGHDGRRARVLRHLHGGARVRRGDHRGQLVRPAARSGARDRRTPGRCVDFGRSALSGRTRWLSRCCCWSTRSPRPRRAARP